MFLSNTRGHAEGSAIGFNRQRKGSRSYYPLFSTIAQTGQFLDLLHRPGNVHDSRDALAFIETNIEIVRAMSASARSRPGWTERSSPRTSGRSSWT